MLCPLPGVRQTAVPAFTAVATARGRGERGGEPGRRGSAFVPSGHGCQSPCVGGRTRRHYAQRPWRAAAAPRSSNSCHELVSVNIRVSHTKLAHRGAPVKGCRTPWPRAACPQRRRKGRDPRTADGVSGASHPMVQVVNGARCGGSGLRLRVPALARGENSVASIHIGGRVLRSFRRYFDCAGTPARVGRSARKGGRPAGVAWQVSTPER